MLTNTGIFLHGLKLPEKIDLSKNSWYPKKKIGGNHAFLRDKLQFEKECHTLLCILKLVTNTIHALSLKNAWLPQI